MSFTSGRHSPNDFSVLGDAARKEAVKKGSAYMNVWMYAIREFEDAIDDCTSCDGECNEYSLNSGSVHAWDEGVAFYTGSLEGTETGGDSGGKLVYRLAEKRCENFGTCGPNGDATSGTAAVNIELFTLFAEGARLLERGECSLVRPVVDAIVSEMTVPLVQGSLRYACAAPQPATTRCHVAHRTGLLALTLSRALCVWQLQDRHGGERPLSEECSGGRRLQRLRAAAGALLQSGGCSDD